MDCSTPMICLASLAVIGSLMVISLRFTAMCLKLSFSSLPSNELPRPKQRGIRIEKLKTRVSHPDVLRTEGGASP